MDDDVDDCDLRDHNDNEVDDRDEANSAHPEIEIQKLWPERERAKIRPHLNFEGTFRLPHTTHISDL